MEDSADLNFILSDFWKHHSPSSWGIDTDLVLIDVYLIYKAILTYNGRVVYAAHSDFIPRKADVDTEHYHRQAVLRLLKYPIPTVTITATAR